VPPAGVLAVLALGAIGYLYVGRPVAHVVKKISHPVCHVVTLGKKCK
jgi:hypothetical protein